MESMVLRVTQTLVEAGGPESQPCDTEEPGRPVDRLADRRRNDAGPGNFLIAIFYRTAAIAGGQMAIPAGKPPP